MIYRSLWERKLMVYCDKNNSVVGGSEEIIIPYVSPKDGRYGYFPDFYMKVKQTNETYKSLSLRSN